MQDLPDVIPSWARHATSVDGTRKGIRREVDFAAGSSKVTVTGVDSATGDKVTVTIDVSPSALATALAGNGLDVSGDTLVVDPEEFTSSMAGHGLDANGDLLDVDETELTPALLTIHPGLIVPYAGSSAPTGWLLTYGQAVSRTTYADLFTAIGTTFGVGDGSTTFGLPDLRGRVAVALDNMGGSDAGRLAASNTLGGSGGTETHTLSAAESGIPAHTHNRNGTTNFYVVGTGGTGTAAGSNLTQVTTTGDVTGGAAAASQAHNNMQPYIFLNYLIKT